MKLIPNWKKAWRMFSVQAMSLATALQGAWLAVPADWQARVPGLVVHILTGVLLVAGILGRLIEQPKTKE